MPVIKKRKPGTFMHWKLRAATPADIESVREVLRTCELPVAGLEDQFGENYVVAVRGGEILGVAGAELHGSHGLLRSVAVMPDARGDGLAVDLIKNRIEWARKRGVSSIFLLTTTAEGYFAQHGFVRADREAAPREIRASKEFSEMCPSTAAFMRWVEGDEKHTADSIRENVREYYGRAAKDAKAGRNACCGGSCEGTITSDLYAAGELEGIPEDAILASLGCGNPVLLAELRAGETVLDLGAGGGIDVLLSARRVGPTGKAYGLDMTDEMLELARENQRRANVTNVEFLKGQIEEMPLPDATVDVIISNCVINLSADKRRVLGEAFRVLKPGGRFAVSDVVVRREIPAAIRRNAELWAGCVAGALEEWTYRDLLRDAGFENIEVVPTRIYSAEDAGLLSPGLEMDAQALKELDGAFMSAFVRATKPLVTRGGVR